TPLGCALREQRSSAAGSVTNTPRTDLSWPTRATRTLPAANEHSADSMCCQTLPSRPGLAFVSATSPVAGAADHLQRTSREDIGLRCRTLPGEHVDAHRIGVIKEPDSAREASLFAEVRMGQARLTRIPENGACSQRARTGSRPLERRSRCRWQRAHLQR